MTIIDLNLNHYFYMLIQKCEKIYTIVKNMA